MSLKIDLKIFALVGLFYFTKQLDIYLLVMIFAIIHELAHLVVGLILGERPKEIKLTPLGLSMIFKINVNEYNKKIRKANLLELNKILIAFAGPLTNIIIIIMALLLNIEYSKQECIVYSNLLIAAFNLLPIYPLDGGRITKGILHIYFGKAKSEKIMNDISIIFTIFITAIASVAVYYYQNIAIFLITIYVWYLVIRENKSYKMKERIYKVIKSK